MFTVSAGSTFLNPTCDACLGSLDEPCGRSLCQPTLAEKNIQSSQSDHNSKAQGFNPPISDQDLESDLTIGLLMSIDVWRIILDYCDCVRPRLDHHV
jgi:hypothetical protein